MYILTYLIHYLTVYGLVFNIGYIFGTPLLYCIHSTCLKTNMLQAYTCSPSVTWGIEIEYSFSAARIKYTTGRK